MSKRKQHTPEVKAKVALEALKGEETGAVLACQIKALALQLVPRLADTVDLTVFVSDPPNLGPKLCVTLMPCRSFGRVRSARKLVIEC